MTSFVPRVRAFHPVSKEQLHRDPDGEESGNEMGYPCSLSLAVKM